MVPADVYTAKLQPRHSRRRYSLSEHERKLLQSVGVELAKAEAGGDEPEAETGLV